MATFKRIAYILSLMFFLALLPSSAFCEFDKAAFIHSARATVTALKRLQARCEVDITRDEYARALDDVQNAINRLEEDFTMYAETIPRMGSISLYFDFASGGLLASLHQVICLHEVVRDWWKREIQTQRDYTCLDLMSSDEWEEIALLVEEASEYLEGLGESLK